MAGGTFDKAVGKVRPGTYINFESANQETLSTADRGTVLIPLIGHTYGPAKEFITISNAAVDAAYAKLGYSVYDDNPSMLLMSYIKTKWVDHLKSSNTFNITQNADGTYNITPAGNVVQQGTPMSAENLNHIEDGIVDVNQQCAINRTVLGFQSKNLFNETEYLSSIASVSIGTFNISGNSITLTATGKDCYTKPHASGDGGYRIPVNPDTDYILSWESDNSNDGYVYAFMNGSLSQQKLANNKDTKYFKFTTNSNTTFITIRLGVSNSGDSITYSNIMLRYADITDDTYEPYQPSLQEQISALIARIKALENK